MDTSSRDIRHDWTADEFVAVHDRPLLELIGEANRLHRAYHTANYVQKESLLSVKTGG